MMFFELADIFAQNVAIYEVDTGISLTYATLSQMVDKRVRDYGNGRKLIFLAADNNIHAVVDYLAALKGGHVVHLLEDTQKESALALIDTYNPNLVIDKNGNIERHNAETISMHKDLALLLSTSGSTGTPKFVKLSLKNIQSNAQSICEYLGILQTDKTICHLKLHYSYGMSILNSHLNAGATTILTNDNIISDEFWVAVKKFQATSFAGVPHNYESLLHNNFHIQNYPSIRYATQAGGKLSSSLVKRLVAEFEAAGAQFIVMYGQTEAAPRISYLPADMAANNPHTIGKAIPQGELFVIDENGNRILQPGIEGELAYKGPNIMMGYASCSLDLSTDETPDILRTGDIAGFNNDGMFYITGRTKRFVKPFGLRINLDDVQNKVKLKYPVSAVTGNDNKIVIAVSDVPERNFKALQKTLSEEYNMPEALFKIGYMENLPLLSSGKYNFKEIMRLLGEEKEKSGMLGRVWKGILDILEIRENAWGSILELFRDILEDSSIQEDACFNKLNTDSLSFVNLSISLEEALGSDLPDQWRNMPIKELDEIFYRRKVG